LAQAIRSTKKTAPPSTAISNCSTARLSSAAWGTRALASMSSRSCSARRRSAAALGIIKNPVVVAEVEAIGEGRHVMGQPLMGQTDALGLPVPAERVVNVGQILALDRSIRIGLATLRNYGLVLTHIDELEGCRRQVVIPVREQDVDTCIAEHEAVPPVQGRRQDDVTGTRFQDGQHAAQQTRTRR